MLLNYRRFYFSDHFFIYHIQKAKYLNSETVDTKRLKQKAGLAFRRITSPAFLIYLVTLVH